MRAFVIKNKEGKYYRRYFDAGYVEFVDHFSFAELYTEKEGADDTKDFILRNKYKFNIENLEVVEITIVEGNLEQQLAEKNKEIEELKTRASEKDKEINKLSEEHLEMSGDMKTYKNLWLAEQRKNKEILKQVCDKIRTYDRITNKQETSYTGYVEGLCEMLDRIEKGEQ